MSQLADLVSLPRRAGVWVHWRERPDLGRDVAEFVRCGSNPLEGFTCSTANVIAVLARPEFEIGMQLLHDGYTSTVTRLNDDGSVRVEYTLRHALTRDDQTHRLIDWVVNVPRAELALENYHRFL